LVWLINPINQAKREREEVVLPSRDWLRELLITQGNPHEHRLAASAAMPGVHAFPLSLREGVTGWIRRSRTGKLVLRHAAMETV
jgi:hypothetical protein